MRNEASATSVRPARRLPRSRRRSTTGGTTTTTTNPRPRVRLRGPDPPNLPTPTTRRKLHLFLTHLHLQRISAAARDSRSPISVGRPQQPAPAWKARVSVSVRSSPTTTTATRARLPPSHRSSRGLSCGSLHLSFSWPRASGTSSRAMAAARPPPVIRGSEAFGSRRIVLHSAALAGRLWRLETRNTTQRPCARVHARHGIEDPACRNGRHAV
mmetsp:Transcript_1413/g.2694  ORF Transcript_1413/g.2694 Transcript_1413/m.2694 type:complete len:213 (+) Transcript_1413:1869-2507(+)